MLLPLCFTNGITFLGWNTVDSSTVTITNVKETFSPFQQRCNLCWLTTPEEGKSSVELPPFVHDRPDSGEVHPKLFTSSLISINNCFSEVNSHLLFSNHNTLQQKCARKTNSERKTHISVLLNKAGFDPPDSYFRFQ